MSSVTGEMETITPEQAAELLTRNIHRNRNLRRKHVLDLARKMQRGEWQDNGETIKIAPDGTLIDGQHRLTACVESGVTIISLVARNVPKESYKTIDKGVARSGGDYLKYAGYENATTLASVLNFAQQVQERSDSVGVSNDQMDRMLECEEASWQESLRVGRRANSHTGVPVSVSAVAHFKCKALAAEEADAFFNAFADGAGLPYGSPILALRKAVTNAQRDGRRMRQKDWYALIIKAWNKWRAGKEVQALRIGKTEDLYEEPK